MEEDTNRAYGVLMENGDYHTAPIIVSGVGGSNTYERLLDAKCMWSNNSGVFFSFLFYTRLARPQHYLRK